MSRKSKARFFPPKEPPLRGKRFRIKKRKCDYCDDMVWFPKKLPNGLRRCNICALPPDERRAARSKLAVKEGEGLIETPKGGVVKPVGSSPDLIVKPNQG